jgi:hypothetical protein
MSTLAVSEEPHVVLDGWSANTTGRLRYTPSARSTW